MTAEIAEHKKQENIVEYILMMWQCEDLVRAFQFDPLQLDNYVLAQFGEESDQVKNATRKWYGDLLKEMRTQKLEKSGHIADLKELLTELIFLHNTLLNISKDNRYIDLFKITEPHLKEFKEKMDNPNRHPVEAYLNGLYGLLLLKLQKKEVTKGTQESIGTFAQIMSYLARQYKEMKDGLLDYSAN
ncbi:MAG: DUF4924 family protein [Bacteroidota bacterium]